jgi:hypothetical protein
VSETDGDVVYVANRVPQKMPFISWNWIAGSCRKPDNGMRRGYNATGAGYYVFMDFHCNFPIRET